MSFYRDINYLPPDVPPEDLLRILILTHLFLINFKRRSFILERQRFQTADVIQSLEAEIKQLLAGDPPSRLAKTRIKTDNLLENNPEVANFLKTNPKISFDLAVAINAFDSGNLPWWWELDPLAERLQNLVIERDTDPEKWLEVSRLFFKKGFSAEGILALEDSLWGNYSSSKSLLEDLVSWIPEGDLSHPNIKPYIFVVNRFVQIRRTPWKERPAIYKEIYKFLQQSRGLRKKTKWLLWTSVLRETQDPFEFEKQREEIVAELALRGVENSEVPSYVKKVLAKISSERLTESADQGLELLKKIQITVNNIPDFASIGLPAKAILLGILGQAFTILGDSNEAKKIADQIETDNNPVACFWQAALKQEKDFSPKLQEAMAALKLLGKEAVEEEKSRKDSGKVLSKTSKISRTRIIFTECFRALENMEIVSSEITENIFKALDTCGINTRIMVIEHSIESLVRMGAIDLTLDYIMECMDAGVVQINKQTRLIIMARLCEADVTQDKKLRAIQLIFKTLRDDNLINLIDEFSVDTLTTLFKNIENPEDVASQLANQVDHDFKKIIIKIALIRAYAEHKESDTGSPLLANTLKEAWGLLDGKSCDGQTPASLAHRALTRLIRIVPTFGLIEWGYAIMRQVGADTKAAENYPKDKGINNYFINEINRAICEAISKLGDTQSTFEILEGSIQLTLRQIAAQTAAGGRDPVSLLFGSLEEYCKVIALLGDIQRGGPLLEGIRVVIRNCIAEAAQKPNPSSFYCKKAMISSIQAIIALGEEAHFELSIISSKNSHDEGELLEMMVGVAKDSQGEEKYRIIDQIFGYMADQQVNLRNESMERSNYFANLRRLIEAIVQGKDNYLKALQLWKNQEELIIRDRVVIEAL